jgi:quinol monooxygenase YgiN
MPAPLALYIEYRPKPGCFDAFVERLRAEADDTIRDDGCLRMEVALPQVPDGRVFLIELWRDQTALDAHARKPGHSHAWQEPLLAEKRVAKCVVAHSPSA